MTDHNEKQPDLPTHIEDTIRMMTQFHAEHYRTATPFQRAVDSTTMLLCRPAFVGLLTITMAVWMLFNSFAIELGFRRVDPPPFSWLGGAVTVASLYMVVLILITQRREDQLTQRREQLTLELAILSDQKIAKVIKLLEESRRDNPLIRNRVDQEAEAMGHSADPNSVLQEITKTHAQAEQINGPKP